MWAASGLDVSAAGVDAKPKAAEADLNASLKNMLGEEGHKALRITCGKLMKKTCSVDDFHQHCLGLFQSKENGMTLYRRLVLSLPDGDKAKLLVSLVDEAVAVKAKAEKDAADATAIPPEAPSSSVTAGVPQGGEAVADDSAAAAQASTPPPVPGPSTSAGGGGGEAAEGAAASEAPAEDAAEVIARTKAASESKEKAILTVCVCAEQPLASLLTPPIQRVDLFFLL